MQFRTPGIVSLLPFLLQAADMQPSSLLATLEVDKGLRAACSYEEAYPRQYIVYKTNMLSPNDLDGDLTKVVWTEVPWTDDFVDISTKTLPRLRTRAKIRWDDEFLYVGAQLDEPQIWGTLTKHDSVIFQDNDFEVFVDPDASTHNYKEFEMNVLNTTWMLLLNKPYNDGGHENSTRVDPKYGWTMQPPLRSATKVVPVNALNDPNVKGRYWSVEIALPLKSLIYETNAELPVVGSFWRLGFSRVEWHLKVDPITGAYVKDPSCQSCPVPGSPNEDNWVWSPQGEIAMHLPERWGILQFADSVVGSTKTKYYSEWPSRSAAMAIYYAQHAYAKNNTGRFTKKLKKLIPFSSQPFPLCQEAALQTSIKLVGTGFEASVISPSGAGIKATVRDDRYLTVEKVPEISAPVV